MKRFRFLIALAFLFFALSHSAVAQQFTTDIEWSVVEQLDLEHSPLDVAASADGKWLYVLAPGEIMLYSFPQRAVVKHISVDEGYDMVTVTQDESYLILSGVSTRKIKIIQLTKVYFFTTDDLPSFGPDDAEVTIVIFNDYQCPYCKNLTPLLEQVMGKYPGRVRVVYKNFPLAMHKSARLAATAALAADRQHKHEEFRRALYEYQHLLDEAKIEQLAADLGLNSETFSNDMKDSALQQLISRDISEAQQAGVRGTPTVFVNGKRLTDRTLQGFSAIIDAKFGQPKVASE